LLVSFLAAEHLQNGVPLIDEVKMTQHQVVVGMIQSIVAFLSFILNIILLVLTRKSHQNDFFRKMQRFLLQNLSFSCLLLIVTMVTSAVESLADDWMFGDIPCKINNWLKVIGIFLQAFFTTLLSLEIFLHLQFPKLLKKIENNFLGFQIGIFIGGWVCSILLSHPSFYRSTIFSTGESNQCRLQSYDYDSRDFNDFEVFNVTYEGDIYIEVPENFTSYYDQMINDNSSLLEARCSSSQQSPRFRVWMVSISVFTYILPSFLITCLYIVYKMIGKVEGTDKDVKKVDLKMLKQKIWIFLTVLIFVVCWLPSTSYKLSKEASLPLSIQQCMLFRDISFIMGYLSCLILPIPSVVCLFKIKESEEEEVRLGDSLDDSPLFVGDAKVGFDGETRFYSISK